MADVKISALPTVVTATGADAFPMVQSGVTKQESLSQALTWIRTQANVFTAAQTIMGVVHGTDSFNIGGQKFFHVAGGGGGGSVYENLFFGYKAGNVFSGTGYANTVIGREAGLALNGDGSLASSNVLIGYHAGRSLTTGSFNTFVGTAAGQGSPTTQDYNTFIGWHAGILATSNENTIVGYGAGISAITGTSNTFIGANSGTATTSGEANMFLGNRAGRHNTTGSANVYLGLASGDNQTTQSNQFIAGSGNYPINDVWFGKGSPHATPTAYTIHGTDGLGTNIVGAALRLAGGRATGNAAGGDIVFQTSDAGSSGTTIQSLTTKMTVRATGIDVVGSVQADGLRLDLTPTAETPTMTHTITISVNGTNYKVPLVAA